MEKLPIVSLAIEGISDTIHTVRRTPVLFALFWLGDLAISMFVAAVSALPPGSPRLPIFVTLALALWSILASCLAVTQQRFVILSEINTAASLVGRWRIVLPIGFTIFAIRLVLLLPAILANLFLSERDAALATLSGGMVVGAALFAFAAPRLLWLPAYAVEDRDCSLTTAAQRGSGSIMRTIIAAIIASMPPLSLGFLFAFERDLEPAGLAAKSLTEILAIAAMAAVLARVFAWRTMRRSEQS